MKKIWQSVAILVFVCGTASAQPWEAASGGIYYNAGSVGIGTADPTDKLHVFGGRVSVTTGGYGLSLASSGTTTRGGFLQTKAGSDWNTALAVFDSGIGIGTGQQVPAARLHVGGTNQEIRFDYDGTSSYFGSLRWAGLQLGNNGQNRIVAGRTTPGGLIDFYVNNTNDGANYNNPPNGILAMRIHSNGNVGIGTGATAPLQKLHVEGDVLVSGNIAAKYQDVAEWVASAEDLEPGTVVVLDGEVPNRVTASTRAYDTAVAGVVSAAPGILLGEQGASKERVATTGRLKVRVDATREAIRIGDLLVTSDRRGTAMKSQPVDVAGVAMHRPGTVVGKALEPLPDGVGEILVLLSLQ